MATIFEPLPLHVCGACQKVMRDPSLGCVCGGWHSSLDMRSQREMSDDAIESAKRDADQVRRDMIAAMHQPLELQTAYLEKVSRARAAKAQLDKHSYQQDPADPLSLACVRCGAEWTDVQDNVVSRACPGVRLVARNLKPQDAKMKPGAFRPIPHCTGCGVDEGAMHFEHCSVLADHRADCGHEADCAVFTGSPFVPRDCSCRAKADPVLARELLSVTRQMIDAGQFASKPRGAPADHAADFYGLGFAHLLCEPPKSAGEERQDRLWRERMQRYNDELWYSHNWDHETDICRACDMTAQAMVEKRAMCKPVDRKPGTDIARAFAMGHSDDHADRLTPARRAGLD